MFGARYLYGYITEMLMTSGYLAYTGSYPGNLSQGQFLMLFPYTFSRIGGIRKVISGGNALVIRGPVAKHSQQEEVVSGFVWFKAR